MGQNSSINDIQADLVMTAANNMFNVMSGLSATDRLQIVAAYILHCNSVQRFVGSADFIKAMEQSGITQQGKSNSFKLK